MKFDFLLTGPGRSGTTLMWRLLAAHSDMFVSFEPLSGPCGKPRTTETVLGGKQPLQYAGRDDWSLYYKNYRYIHLERIAPPKILCMRRDIADVVYSWATRAGYGLSAPRLKHLKGWAEYSYEYLEEHVAKHNVPLLYVDFDRVCNDTEAVLREACEFIGVEFEPEMLIKWNEVKVDGRPTIVNYNTDAIQKPDHSKEDKRKIFDEVWATL